MIGVYEFLPNSEFLTLVGGVFCKDDALTQKLCGNVLFLMCGFNQDQLNTTLLPVIMGQLPAGSSTNQLLHYAQGINSGKGVVSVEPVSVCVSCFMCDLHTRYKHRQMCRLLALPTKYREFSYGMIKNLAIYGSLTPPDYDLSKITAPVFLHWSDNDWMADTGDVRELQSKLPNVKGSIRVPLATFNHLDYMWAIDVKPLLYDTVLENMKKF
uniref:Gastric triacylglycerol lipase n=1 Tax=Timema cristinae TaxID=61476 RepID=A0A7R9D9T5_TIMCR|nr:unnamed protein product [Timema cristinae]